MDLQLVYTNWSNYIFVHPQNDNDKRHILAMYIDGFKQKRGSSIANALGSRFFWWNL